MKCKHFFLLKSILPTIGSFLFLSQMSLAATGQWSSKATGTSLAYVTSEPAVPVKDFSGAVSTVVYLENLNVRKIGGNTNAEDVAWLLSQGYRVVELNYAHNGLAKTPQLNADIIAINDALYNGSFCGYTNCSKTRSFVLFEGYRVAHNVAFFKDDPTVYNYPSGYATTSGDSLYMDIVYPVNASEAVPLVLTFSYSNSSGSEANRHQRLNLGNTLAGFDDSMLEGAPGCGIAWAVADHPKYCAWGNGKPLGGANDTYKSYEVNPDAARKVKSAVRTLRALGANLGLSGKIGIYGFSRGSDAGSMAVGDRVVTAFDTVGLHQGVSDDVQAAALGSGVFDFTQVFNATGDGDTNLETRCPWAWGTLANNYQAWLEQGSAYLAQTSASAPVLFFYNTSDALYYQDQIAHFKAKLDSLGVPTSTLINYGSGHAVPQTPASLTTVYDFYKQYLTPPSVATEIQSVEKEAAEPMTVVTDPSTGVSTLRFSLKSAGPARLTVYNAQGGMEYCYEMPLAQSGVYDQILRMDKPGLHLISLVAGNSSASLKFFQNHRN